MYDCLDITVNTTIHLKSGVHIAVYPNDDGWTYQNGPGFARILSNSSASLNITSDGDQTTSIELLSFDPNDNGWTRYLSPTYLFDVQQSGNLYVEGVSLYAYPNAGFASGNYFSDVYTGIRLRGNETNGKAVAKFTNVFYCMSSGYGSDPNTATELRQFGIEAGGMLHLDNCKIQINDNTNNSTSFPVSHVYIDGQSNSSGQKGSLVRFYNSTFESIGKVDNTTVYGIYYTDSGTDGTNTTYVIDDCTFWRCRINDSNLNEFSSFINSSVMSGKVFYNGANNASGTNQVKVQYVARSIHNYGGVNSPYNNNNYFTEISGDTTKAGTMDGYEYLLAPFQPAIG
jgi:hypothetical protein